MARESSMAISAPHHIRLRRYREHPNPRSIAMTKPLTPEEVNAILHPARLYIDGKFVGYVDAVNLRITPKVSIPRDEEKST